MSSYKFRGHETFFIRKGWLYKGLKNVKERPDVFVSKSQNPMDILGIGANMVKSLRYWMQAVGLTKEKAAGVRTQQPTRLGDIIWQYDPCMQETGTLCLLHYKLATNKEGATSWYYFFNEFKLKSFKKEDFITALSNYVKLEIGQEIAGSSLESDFECIINTYLSKSRINAEKIDPENNIDCPFRELGLISLADKKEKIYKKEIPAKEVLPPLIVLAVILTQAGTQREIEIKKLLNEPGSVGRIFNLDIVTLNHYLFALEKMGYIKVIRTAGLDLVKILSELDFYGCIEAYYQDITGNSND
ncbi:DUF4007 family protein [Thermosyntropha sp.]|uniref:DUF4007 family protein n=1 Tax=Thermosyntropha sp. TaxID=2740820 RepID=UPI0025DD8A77|nr:DUF4007 family protein [Thermosyntropha sp.]MBO8159627.1 DUF4007 family protein [Thermosyntropha sp.]